MPKWDVTTPDLTQSVGVGEVCCWDCSRVGLRDARPTLRYWATPLGVWEGTLAGWLHKDDFDFQLNGLIPYRTLTPIPSLTGVLGEF